MGNKEILPFSTRFGWGTGTLTVSLMFQATGLLLLFYLTDVVKIPAATAGLLIALSKVYDAFTDPIMGRISDRTKTPWGKRRPYVMLGTLLCAGSFILLFNLAAFADSPNIIIIVLAALLLNATGYTIFNVPYLAMPAEMTSDHNVRTNLMSFRVMAVAIGQIGGSAGGPALILYFGDGVDMANSFGYTGMANVLAAFMVAAGLICFWLTRKASFVESSIADQGSKSSFLEQFKTAFSIRPFAILLGIKITQLTGFAIFLGSLPYLFSRIMFASNDLKFYFLVQGTVMFASQPLWVYMVGKIGKKNGYYLASLLWGVGGLSWMMEAEGEPTIGIVIRGVLLGLGAGGLILVGQSMLPDTMQYDYQKTGIRREGIFAGVYTTVEIVSFAIGPALLGLIIGYAGYDASAETLSDNVRMVIYLCAGGLPVASLIISCFLMILYNLNVETLKEE